MRNKKGQFMKGSTDGFQKGNKICLGKKCSDETKKKISETNKGYIHSEEAKKKISKATKGKNNPNYGNGDKIKGDKNPNWRGGLSCEPYTFDFTRELKELIRKRDNYTCQKCGKKWLDSMRLFSIHHIDYDKKNCSPDNLITLCQSCNSIVNYNRKYWTGYFQEKLCLKI